MTIWIILAALAVLIIFAAVNSGKNRHTDELDNLKNNWGKLGDKQYPSDDFENISHYYKLCENDGYSVDDITWNDLEMDEIFRALDNCSSSIGREYLYKSLRKPNLDINKIKDIDAAAAYMLSHGDERVSLQMSLSKLGFVHKVSFSDYVNVINELNPLKNSISYLFNALNAYSLYTSFNKVENLSSVSLDIGRLVFSIVGVLMIVTGNIMPKLRMNSMVGLRTHWSMKNEVTWKKCQHMGGISFIIGGIIIIGICIAMKGTPCLLAVLGVWVILIVNDVFLTYKAARRN